MIIISHNRLQQHVIGLQNKKLGQYFVFYLINHFFVHEARLGHDIIMHPTHLSQSLYYICCRA